MPLTRVGQQLSRLSLVAVAVAFGACHANPSPAPASPRDATRVYECAVSELQQDGWQLAAERKEGQPEYRTAAFRRGTATATLTVKGTQTGRVDLQLVKGLFGGSATPASNEAALDQAKARIMDQCMPGRH